MWTDARLRWLLRGTTPLIVGPWVSELGFEVLYWLPFLHYLRHAYQIPRERLFVVSRGGAGFWYDAQQALDLYDYLPPQDLRLAQLDSHQRTHSLKHTSQGRWETKLLAVLAERLGLRSYRVIHPSLMYALFRDWWVARMSLLRCIERLRFAPIPVPLPGPELQLPDRYVAVKFYRRPTWNPNQDLQHWMEDLVGQIATKIPVVLLNTGLPADDHTDLDLPGVQSIAGKVTWANNLLVQSSVLAKAKAFVGTYGGTMQLAVRMRVPAMGFYGEFKETAYSHKLLTEYLGVSQQAPVFIGRPADASFVAQIMAGIQG